MRVEGLGYFSYYLSIEITEFGLGAGPKWRKHEVVLVILEKKCHERYSLYDQIGYVANLPECLDSADDIMPLSTACWFRVISAAISIFVSTQINYLNDDVDVVDEDEARKVASSSPYAEMSASRPSHQLPVVRRLKIVHPREAIISMTSRLCRAETTTRHGFVWPVLHGSTQFL